MFSPYIFTYSLLSLPYPTLVCHRVMSSCHTYITNKIRLHLDNIYVIKLNNNINKLNMSNKLNKLTTKRFVIRQSLIGTNTVITFVNKKGKTITYNHDEVYTRNKERFDSMNCFIKYKSYTNSNNIPTFCR